MFGILLEGARHWERWRLRLALMGMLIATSAPSAQAEDWVRSFRLVSGNHSAASHDKHASAFPPLLIRAQVPEESPEFFPDSSMPNTLDESPEFFPATPRPRILRVQDQEDEEAEAPPQPLGESPGEPEEQPTLGEAPEDTRQLFLRTSTILLSPGETAVDYGIQYNWQEFTGFEFIPSPEGLGGPALGAARVRARQVTTPLAVRYGHSERVQLFANLPFGLQHLERSSIFGDEFSRVIGFGDLSFGFNYLLRQQDATGPDVIATVSASAPIGSDPFERSPNVASLGSGFWNVSSNLLLVKSYDPAVVFGGVGYGTFFPGHFLDQKIDPGDVFTYQFGTGFAVNDHITFSTMFLGAFQRRWRADKRTIPGSSQEPLSIRLALTATMSQCHIIEPFVNFGLTRDAADASIGIIVTRRF